MRLAVIILLSAMSFQQLAGFLIITDYATKVEEITLKYCVNKKKPELKCNGKCHLRSTLKSIETEEEENQRQEEEVIPIYSYAYFDDNLHTNGFSLSFTDDKKLLTYQVSWYQSIKADLSTPPPQV